MQKVTDWKFFLCLRCRVNLTIPNENGSLYAWNLFLKRDIHFGVFFCMDSRGINDRLTILLPILLLNNYKFNLYVWKINVSTLTSLNLSSFKELIVNFYFHFWETMKANGKLGGTVINYINTNLSFICLFGVMTETIIDNDNSLLHWFI